MKKKEFGLLLILLVLDLVSKQVIESTMQLGESIPVITNFFYITYAVNTGAAWSILEGKMIFFYIATCIGILAICWMLYKTNKQHIYTRFALVLMLAGAIGNFIDRILFQHVRDFLDFYIFGYNFPIFNVADMCLCSGVFIIGLLIFLNKEDSNELF